jgi:tetratricopeptide (TPR) repeat protein
LGKVHQGNDKIISLNPYPGPRPFKKEEQNLFFGREIEIGELFSLINAHQVLLVYAQSGAGKSSLLNAGLIPLMLNNGFEIIQSNGFGGGIPKEVRLEKAANAFVFNTLMQWAEEKINAEQLMKNSIADFLRQKVPLLSKRGTRAPRVVIFDQFEEIFTFYLDRWRDRETFFEQLSEALENDPFLRIVFAIREDFLAQLDPYATFMPEKLRTRFRLERLREETALLAITEPLKGSGRSFADRVAETLVEDLLKIWVERDFGEGVEVTEVKGEFVEPVQLQVVCRSIWNKLPPDVSQIDYGHLRSAGNVDAALSQFYDDAIQEVVKTVDSFESMLRHWCEENLITPMGTRNLVYREPETTSGLPNLAIDVLERTHLIRAERRAGGRWYELTHDRFIQPIQFSNAAYFKRAERASVEAYLVLWQGDEEVGNKNYDSAIASYKNALAIYRENGLHDGEAIALRQLGNILSYTQKYNEALQYYEAALSISVRANNLASITVETLLGMSDVYFNWEDFEEAVRLAGKAIELAPTNPKAYHRRAGAYWYWGRFSESVVDYTKELELIPETDAIWTLNGRGQVLAEMGEYQRAVGDLQRAVKLGEQKGLPLAYPLNGLGLALAGLGNYREALHVFEQSIEKEPDNAWVYYNRAQAYMFMGKTDKAIEDLKTALNKKNPQLNPYKRERAKYYLQQQTKVN